MANMNSGGKNMGTPGFGGMPAVKLTPRKSMSPGYPTGNFPDATFGQKRVSAPGTPSVPFGNTRKPKKPTGMPDFC